MIVARSLRVGAWKFALVRIVIARYAAVTATIFQDTEEGALLQMLFAPRQVVTFRVVTSGILWNTMGTDATTCSTMGIPPVLMGPFCWCHGELVMQSCWDTTYLRMRPTSNPQTVQQWSTMVKIDSSDGCSISLLIRKIQNWRHIIRYCTVFAIIIDRYWPCWNTADILAETPPIFFWHIYSPFRCWTSV